MDRHLATRADQKALVWISTEVDREESDTYRELHAGVRRIAAVMHSFGVGKGDRVIVCMPNTP